MARLTSDGFDVMDARWIEDHFVAIGWGEPKLSLESPYMYESNHFASVDECQIQKDRVLKTLNGIGRFSTMQGCLSYLYSADSNENLFCSVDVGYAGSDDGYRLNRIHEVERIGAGSNAPSSF